MLNTLGIVEVPHNSLSGRARTALAVRRFAGKTLLEWVVRRVTDSQRLDQVLIVARDGDPRVREVTLRDVPVLTANADPLQATVDALHAFPARAVVRVAVTNPFVDPVMLDRLVTSADGFAGDYLGYCFSDGRPAIHSQLGVVGEWCRAEAIQRADQEATNVDDRSSSTRFILSHPDKFQLRLIPLPVPLDRNDLRLQLDSEEDWEHACEIYDALGPEGLDFQTIAGLLDHNPAIRERMARLNQMDGPVSTSAE